MPLDAVQPGDQGKAYYNLAWKLYFGVLGGKGVESDIEKAYGLFREAAAIFQQRGERFEAAKALSGLSVVAGMLCKGDESIDCARRSVALMEALTAGEGARDAEKLEWLMKGLRSLADSVVSTEERLRCGKKGLEILAQLSKSHRPIPWVKRYQALFNRAAGSAMARLRPRTDKSLAESEKYLMEAAYLFKEAQKTEKIKVSLGKTLRELSRTLRARAGLARVEKRTSDVVRHLKAAEDAARTTIEAYQRAGESSQWNHYHLAKILRDLGQPQAALDECLEAVEVLEEGREKISEDGNRISYLNDSLAIYDLGVCLAEEREMSETGFDLSQRCKARVFLERFRGKIPVRPSRDFGTIPGHRDLQKFLKEDEGLIEYHLGKHAVSIFVLTAKDLKAVRVPCVRKDVEQMVSNFQGFMRQTPNEVNAALCSVVLKELSSILVGPVAGLLNSCRRLFVVPSGHLSYLPFSALPLSDGRLFIERWEASYLPSASMLPSYTSRSYASRSNESRERKLLAIANPTEDLWYAEDEAQEVSATFPESEVFVGEKATKKALAGIDGATHVHIACHGQYSADESLGSHLILAPGKNDDGILGVGEISNLPFANVDLAFLSCCKSAYGRNKGGDEFDGIHRAFLFAGAKSVVVTLWDIEDAVTHKLVVSFYGHLKAGLPKSEALHRAKLEVLKRHPHPFYWAAFKLVGSPA